MNRTFKPRLAGFALAIVIVALMIGWAAHASWRQFDQLSRQLTEMQIESFKTADQFRANVQELDYVLLRYTILRDEADRDRFLKEWKKMDTWIDIQRPTLTTDKEGKILDQINAAYDDYFAAATNLLQQVVDRTSNDRPLAAFRKIEDASSSLLGLGYQLVNAHHESLTRFLADSQRSLAILRELIFGALFLLLVLVASLAVVVYREMIMPLRMKLVESHAIIQRQEKLASLGVLAAGVAHEIRNPLTAIKARLFTQQKSLEHGSSAYEDTVVIGKEINRLERIVKDVLQFARPPEPHLVPVRADFPLREVAELMAPQLAKNAIHLKLGAMTEAMIQADSQQLKQVLINLIQNAAESIGRSGAILLRAHTGMERLNGQTRAAVILEVDDTGKGISSEVQKRLFDPFFSTKAGGTGLGLAIAARIVQKHGGVLRFRTQLNQGTAFGIVLPKLEPK
ncbi:MAG: hypothetical protein DME22_00140 [Verrucomicrobia bacterium]|nr:MAG: hypothetical protein DME22_00140 [Verrucomicrobiota bacterium]PYJ98033.1 MAG: hypothetical protein DME23_13260 [Verrucomicrobiota bacterium]